MTSPAALATAEGSRFISTVSAPWSRASFMNSEAGLTWADVPIIAKRSAFRIAASISERNRTCSPNHTTSGLQPLDQHFGHRAWLVITSGAGQIDEQ